LRLADFPGIGAPRPGLGDGIRIYVIDPYVVIYEGGQDSDTVIVHRVVHGHRDIKPDLIER
jgi:toxin ParE1/3/4